MRQVSDAENQYSLPIERTGCAGPFYGNGMGCLPQEEVLRYRSWTAAFKYSVQLCCYSGCVGLSEYRPQGWKEADRGGRKPWPKQPMTLPINGQYGEISIKNDGGQRKPFEQIEACRRGRK